MRLAIFAVLAALGTLPAALPTAAQTLSPLTGSDAVTPQRTPGASAPAARRQPRMTMQARFDAANTTHDGKLTLDQAKAGSMPRVAENFDAIDTKKNGYVTVEDIRAYTRAQRAARRGAKP